MLLAIQIPWNRRQQLWWRALKSMGIKCILVTGNNWQTARSVADEVWHFLLILLWWHVFLGVRFLPLLIPLPVNQILPNHWKNKNTQWCQLMFIVLALKVGFISETSSIISQKELLAVVASFWLSVMTLLFSQTNNLPYFSLIWQVGIMDVMAEVLPAGKTKAI